jgi:hypothetical protein
LTGPPGSVRSGGVPHHGEASHPATRTLSISLRLTRILANVQNACEIVVTNTGQSPIDIPIGSDTIRLLDSREEDRRYFVFAVTLGNDSHHIGLAMSASNSAHPESRAMLQPGDTVIFKLPVTYWSGREQSRGGKVAVLVLLNRKAIESGKEWTEAAGDVIHSENSLPLP